MEIQNEIQEIIKKRQDKVPALQARKTHLNEILAEVRNINEVRSALLENAKEIQIPSDISLSVESINTTRFESAMGKLLGFYDNIIKRFSRPEISIAVVGKARQGKSQLLQTISSLDDRVIPAFSNNDCTGASSVIKNVPGSSLRADITFMDELEMIDAVQAYLDNIFGEGYRRLRRFEDIGQLQISELRKNIPQGSAKTAQFEHLIKYIEHFNDWSDLVRKENVTITDPDEIQKYVAQHNGKTESSPERENYYRYLAVKEAVISCEFNNPDTGSIILRDTIGLGDTSLGISDKMLDTISSYSDAAVIISRPEAGTGKFDETDENLYMQLNEAFEKRNMRKWLFWLINNTDKGNIYNDNSDRCTAFKNKLDSLEWNIANSYIVNAADKEEVNGKFLPSLLRTLISNIDEIDQGIMTELQELTEDAFKEFRSIQDAVKKVLFQGAGSEVDKNEFLRIRWDMLYGSGLMKLLKEYKRELLANVDNESDGFRKKVNEILKNSMSLIPSKSELLEQLQKGGRNRGIDVYTRSLDMLRTEFTREFINIDEEVFDKQVKVFKERVVNIFASDEGGRLGRLLPVVDYDTPDEWLKAFAVKYFADARYEQFKVAFIMLTEFDLTVRGFLMHRIRDRIDMLDPTDYDNPCKSDEDEAEKLWYGLSRKLKDVREELIQKFKDELFREPNRVFYAIASEFYDRLNFSYQDNTSAERTWEMFYYAHLVELWSDEFQNTMKQSKLFRGWSALSEQLSKINKQDFLGFY